MTGGGVLAARIKRNAGSGKQALCGLGESLDGDTSELTILYSQNCSQVLNSSFKKVHDSHS